MSKLTLSRSLRWLFAGLIVIVVGLAAWQLLIVGQDDPRDLRYQAWKLGVYPLKTDKALQIMIEDPHRDRLVIGKTEEQLARRFETVSSTPENAYIAYCYENSQYRGQPVLFIRHSNWMVLMKDGVAHDLVLAEGC